MRILSLGKKFCRPQAPESGFVLHEQFPRTSLARCCPASSLHSQGLHRRPEGRFLRRSTPQSRIGFDSRSSVHSKMPGPYRKFPQANGSKRQKGGLFKNRMSGKSNSNEKVGCRQQIMNAKGTHDVTPNTIIVSQFTHRENRPVPQATRRETIVIVIMQIVSIAKGLEVSNMEPESGKSPARPLRKGVFRKYSFLFKKTTTNWSPQYLTIRD